MVLYSDEDIRVCAYHLWEADGCPEGRDLEYWQRAQQSLAAPPARKTVRRTARTQPAAAAGERKAAKPAKRRGS